MRLASVMLLFDNEIRAIVSYEIAGEVPLVR
jgi:hypothetical protein